MSFHLSFTVYDKNTPTTPHLQNKLGSRKKTLGYEASPLSQFLLNFFLLLSCTEATLMEICNWHVIVCKVIAICLRVNMGSRLRIVGEEVWRDN